MLIAKDFLSVGLSSQKNFNYSQHASPTVILREAEGEVAESIIEKIALAFRERWGRRRWWERAIEEHFPPPLIRPDGHFLSREKVIFRVLKCGFCNFGQALRAE